MTGQLFLGALRTAPARCSPVGFFHNPRFNTTISRSSGRRSLLTLAIETSCDDTCVAVVEKSGAAARLLFNRKVTSDNTAFGGVHPGLAILSHTATLPGLVEEAIRALPSDGTGDGRFGHRLPDFISVTRGPGMSTNLAVGINVAKGLAVAWKVPLLAVHHMQAHALTPRLVNALQRPWPSSSPSSTPTASGTTPPQHPPTPAFPFLTLLVSGGHTQLVLSRSVTSHSILANSSPLAIGNMLDATARLVLTPSTLAASSSVSYGPALEEFAFPGSLHDDGGEGNPSNSPSNTYDYGYTPPPSRRDEIATFTSSHGWTLTPPLANRRAMEYCFSGLGSQVQRIIEARLLAGEELDIEERRALAIATMRLAFEHLATRIIFALGDLKLQEKEMRKKQGGQGEIVLTLVLSGGVASNRFMRHVIRSILDVRGFGHVRIVAPPVELCTDNAAMIAWTGIEMWEAGYESGLDVCAIKKWSVDPTHEDGGILGVDSCNFKIRPSDRRCMI